MKQCLIRLKNVKLYEAIREIEKENKKKRQLLWGFLVC